MGGKRVFTGDLSKRLKKSLDRNRSAAEATSQSTPKVQATPAPKPAPQPMPAPAPQKKGSVLAADARIFGDVEFKGAFRVDGELQGDARGGALEIGEPGRVDGKIQAEAVRIEGLVTGGVNARSVSVGKTGRILSDVEYVQLTVEAGAQLNGMITPRDAPSVAEVVSKSPPKRPQSKAEPKAKRIAASGNRASRSGIKFAPNAKKGPRPST